MKKVYIVGRFYAQTTSKEHGTQTAWEIMGIFTNEDEAKRNCLTDHDFVGPMEVDSYIGGDRKPWPGCYYPIEGEIK